MNLCIKNVFLLLFLSAQVSCWVKEMENPDLFEGDIELDPDQMEQLQNGTFSYASLKDTTKMWPNARVPYVISRSLSGIPKAVAAIEAAIKDYERYTCLKFVKKRTDEYNYMSFWKGKSCSTQVGYNKRRGKHSISLGTGCWGKATVLHEVGHSLGLYHEQNRPDRNLFVKIDLTNVMYATHDQFKKEPAASINSYGTPFDYLSMMMYKWNAFAVDPNMPSIYTKDPKYQFHIGQEEGFSKTDVRQLNLMYKCKGKYPEPPVYVIVPGCFNKVVGCIKRAYEGECTTNRAYMFTKCKRACAFCDKTATDPVFTPPSCTDKYTWCTTLTSQKCKSSGIYQKYCKLTCKSC